MSEAAPEIVVLTGFLGSGKTTLLREYLDTEAAAETAIIVNEAGEIGLDGALLREAGGDVAMTMLSNGCVCCQATTDLTATVEALLAAPRPDPDRPLRRIVLETSGLSKPGPILRQLAPLAAHRLRLAVVATFDPTRPVASAGFEEAAAQWAAAHRIVLTKADSVAPAAFAAAAAEARAINPFAEIVAEPDRRAAALRALAAPPRPGTWPVPDDDGRLGADAHPRISTLCLRQRGPIGADDLATWLDNLAGALGDRLLRVKGLVRVEESTLPVLVQSVGTLFGALAPFRGQPPAAGLFLVVIAFDLDRAELAALTPTLRLELPRSTGRPASRARPLRAEAV
ncbi:GTP-binding protein [Enterovirga sp.]|uniref:CobW family GTP-binding protein n=1 Tax=Enterovirga sp. TaxID=2026350 RepID=UPI002623A99A|nr:GTP-binding protein [Enterovirga sp.]MDB5590223.1 cobalamin synthesis protein [Enterovirga sp.]